MNAPTRIPLFFAYTLPFGIKCSSKCIQRNGLTVLQHCG